MVVRLSPAPTQLPDLIISFCRTIKKKIAARCHHRQTRHGSTKVFVSSEVNQCPTVFIHTDAVRLLLQPLNERLFSEMTIPQNKRKRE